MERIAYVAHAKHGEEPACREVLQAHTPTGGHKRLGSHYLELFKETCFV